MSEWFDTEHQAAWRRPRRRASAAEVTGCLLLAVVAAVGVATSVPGRAEASRVHVQAEPPGSIVAPDAASTAPTEPTDDSAGDALGASAGAPGPGPDDTGNRTTATATAVATATELTVVAAVGTVPERTAPAPATTIPAAGADPGPAVRGEAALATIEYPWRDRLPGWTIVFLDGHDGLFGLTKVDDRRIEIYVRPDQPNGLLAHVIAHEIGHAIDVTWNDGSDRRRWQAARHIEDDPWWPGDGATDFSTGAGDFAESFAAWQVGTESFRSELAGPPDVAQVELLAELADEG